MNKGLLTPLGEIEIYIDNVRSDYQYEPIFRDIRSLQMHPVEGSYQIKLPVKDWQTIRCVISLYDPQLENIGASGERYLYSEFVKDNIILTIGAGADQTDFDTNRLRYGVEYVRRKPVDKVMFAVAWATDYQQYDVRTQLATDLY